MGSFTTSLIFAAGLFIGTALSMLLVRKTGFYSYVWNQIKRKKHWLNLLQWSILSFFVVAVFVGFGSLISSDESMIRFLIGLGLGLTMALLPIKEAK